MGASVGVAAGLALGLGLGLGLTGPLAALVVSRGTIVLESNEDLTAERNHQIRDSTGTFGKFQTQTIICHT